MPYGINSHLFNSCIRRSGVHSSDSRVQLISYIYWNSDLKNKTHTKSAVYLDRNISVRNISVMKDITEGKIITEHKTWAIARSLSAHVNIYIQCLKLSDCYEIPLHHRWHFFGSSYRFYVLLLVIIPYLTFAETVPFSTFSFSQNAKLCFMFLLCRSNSYRPLQL
jgi:hypothetical protein